MQIFIEELFKNPQVFCMKTFVVVFSICSHEFAHAYMALLQGDDTAEKNGHLTLNPMRQMGLWSLVTLAILGIAWGSVPVNPAKFKHKYSNLLISFAGPFMNLCLFAVCTVGVTAALFMQDKTPPVLIPILGYAASINIVLFILNMLPIPTLDGWNVLSSLFPLEKLLKKRSEFINGAMLFIVLLLIISLDKIYFLAELIQTYIVSILIRIFVSFL